MKTMGYVEKVTIEWPMEFAQNIRDNCSSYDYTSNLSFTQIENITFILPMNSSKTEYDIYVTAWKDGSSQRKKITLQVEGSIFDSVRVRIH